MRKFFAMMRYSKKLLLLAIIISLDVLCVVGLCVFDVVQAIKISKNAVMISTAFMAVNYVLVSLMLLNIVALIVAIVLKRHKEKDDELKQN